MRLHPGSPAPLHKRSGSRTWPFESEGGSRDPPSLEPKWHRTTLAEVGSAFSGSQEGTKQHSPQSSPGPPKRASRPTTIVPPNKTCLVHTIFRLTTKRRWEKTVDYCRRQGGYTNLTVACLGAPSYRQRSCTPPPSPLKTWYPGLLPDIAPPTQDPQPARASRCAGRHAPNVPHATTGVGGRGRKRRGVEGPAKS